MSHFCLLQDPDNYVADDWDLIEDHQFREYWLGLFEKHFEETMGHAAYRYGRSANKGIAEARKVFSEAIEQLRRDPASLPEGKLDVIALCSLREKTLRSHGLNDPFEHIKDC